MARIPLGGEAVLQVKAGGVEAGGSWVTVADVREITLTDNDTEADVTARSSDGVRELQNAITEISVEGSVLNDPEGDGFAELRNSKRDKTAIGVRVLDSDEEGADYVQFNGQVFGFSKPQPLEDAQVIDFVIKPTRNSQLSFGP